MEQAARAGARARVGRMRTGADQAMTAAAVGRATVGGSGAQAPSSEVKLCCVARVFRRRCWWVVSAEMAGNTGEAEPKKVEKVVKRPYNEWDKWCASIHSVLGSCRAQMKLTVARAACCRKGRA